VVKVAVVMPSSFADPGEFLADVRALEAAGAEMVGLDSDGPREWIVLGAIAAVTDRVRIRLTNAEAAAILDTLSRGRVVLQTPPGESWNEIEMPPDRDSWTSVLREQEAGGAAGVVVPWDPRLIDLLRNAEPDDRSDLLMSTG
jgi:hypothetical protein